MAFKNFVETLLGVKRCTSCGTALARGQRPKSSRRRFTSISSRMKSRAYKCGLCGKHFCGGCAALESDASALCPDCRKGRLVEAHL